MITKVTITGPDDGTEHIKLAQLSSVFPFVEWGILVSKSQVGTPRFPSMQWIKHLREMRVNFKNIKLSCHLCGKYVRQLMMGDDTAITDLGNAWNMFQRIQINFHAIPHTQTEEAISIIEHYKDKEFIFQYDGVNDQLVRQAISAGHNNVSALFDKSGGAGILPDEWPKPLEGIKCGYAGGLSPDNIESEIQKIESIVGDTEIWIDMETHVRSNNDQLFDLDKVYKVLEIAEKYVQY